MDNRPIGITDSGMGGVSVLRSAAALMPNESFIYYGDSKNAPYGTKTVEEVRRLTADSVEQLLKSNVKAIVIACNTATSAAAEQLRGRYSLPIIGIEPALKPAVLHKENSVIAVMATPMTLHEEKFVRLMKKYENMARIIPLPAPELVEFVEKGILDGSELDFYLNKLFEPHRGENIDSVVLGCTHFPFVKQAICRAVGENVRIFDGGEGTARELKRRLTESSSLAEENVVGTVKFFNSEPSAAELSERLFLVQHKCKNRN